MPTPIAPSHRGPSSESRPLTSRTERLRAGWNACAGQLDRRIGHAAIALAARLALAALFFLSGRTKVTGLITVSEGTYTLFREEYRLPLLPPEWAAHLAAYAEHLFPLLLLLGLATRLSALALLGMTAVIQVFVYPDAWPTHLSWAAMLLYLVGRGGGPLSVDRALGIR
ncbi:DoxX family protein [Hylemonella sp. W303a]|uniref:DoxX family protein n=1 Tax=Hylemonella sp. W303a TaxID=3389873 RepID=UPI00396B1D8C